MTSPERNDIDTTGGRGMNRRQFVTLGVRAFVIASLPLAITRRRHSRDAAVVRGTFPVMGTIADLAVAHPDARHAQAAMDAAMAEVRWVERTMTRFTSTSDIGRANLGAAREAVRVTPETALVVAEALRWADTSGGAYDPAVGETIELWDVTHRHEPPPAARLALLAGRHLHRAVEVGSWRGSPVLRYHDPAVHLDLGAIAKGYAVDRAAERLRRAGIAHAVIDIGGDLYALGTAPDGEPWRIGVQDPNDSRRMAAMLDVANAAVATSGTYVQFFRYRGVRYHHLMDPGAAAPRRTPVQSLTLRAASCMHADVAATACYGMSAKETARVLARRAPGAQLVMSL